MEMAELLSLKAYPVIHILTLLHSETILAFLSAVGLKLKFISYFTTIVLRVLQPFQKYLACFTLIIKQR